MGRSVVPCTAHACMQAHTGKHAEDLVSQKTTASARAEERTPRSACTVLLPPRGRLQQQNASSQHPKHPEALLPEWILA